MSSSLHNERREAALNELVRLMAKWAVEDELAQVAATEPNDSQTTGRGTMDAQTLTPERPSHAQPTAAPAQ